MMRISDDTEWVFCSGLDETCEEKIKNHRWGRTKAIGWFFSESENKAYCPDHIPDWVEKWRQRVALAKGIDGRAGTNSDR